MAMYEKNNVKYDMVIDKVKKVFHLSASGFFGADDGNSFINDYNRLVRTFPANEYNLVIDVCELKPTSPEVGELLGALLVRYMEVPFAKRFLLTQGSAVTMMQFKRLGGNISGWTESVKYVKDMNEVYSNI